MVAFYSKARRTHRWFAVVPDNPVQSLPNLKGKRIACDFDHLRPLAEAALADVKRVAPGHVHLGSVARLRYVRRRYG